MTGPSTSGVLTIWVYDFTRFWVKVLPWARSAVSAAWEVETKNCTFDWYRFGVSTVTTAARATHTLSTTNTVTQRRRRMRR